jgi:hypothetical protein
MVPIWTRADAKERPGTRQALADLLAASPVGC